MNRRPSRFVIAIARWALMAGLAGVVLALLAFIDGWRAPENVASRHNLLLVSAVLLSASFVLAPVVRRAFGVVHERQSQQPVRKTLLDEMREQPEGEEVASTNPEVAAHDTSTRHPVLTRLIVGLYVMFGAVLAAVLVLMRQ